MHRDEPATPQAIRKLAVREGVRHAVAAASGLFELEPELAEAAMAHEFAHVALGHCDRRAFWFLSRFKAFPAVRLALSPLELAADRLAARFGYGAALRELRRRLRVRKEAK